VTREERILQGVGAWTAYYRSNPARFAHDYLHLDLRLFQKILLIMMNLSMEFVFIGSRGIGKTFLSAIFCVIRCILYPGTRICIASGTRGQSINVLEKIIQELKPNSPELAAEIDDKETKINGTNAQIVFKNTSVIKVVTASDTSRGNRATLLLLDEFRMISKDVIDTILRKFLTLRRMPRYSALSKEDRKAEYNKEKNKTMYLSSAYWADHWSYAKCNDAYDAMEDNVNKSFVCSLPYHLSIKEGLLDRDLVEAEVRETGFSEIKFSMEYAALFYGVADGSFFDYDSISKNRKILYPMMPDRYATLLGNNNKVRIAQKQAGELRILSADIALMSSKKNNNDATAIFINQLMPTKAGKYSNNIIYCDCCEGLHTEDQALVIRKLYEEFQCDYIVLDTQGVGIGVFDMLAREMYDIESGEIYPPLSCCNDSTMAERCSSRDAEKVIWSIKANAALNSECAILLREGFRSGKIRLLVQEYDGEQNMNELKGFASLSPMQKEKLLIPYKHTTLLINELINLQHDESAGRVKLKEKAGMRKDRYSSLSYNYYVSAILESRLRRKKSNSMPDDAFIIKAPSITRKAVSGDRGRRNTPSWY
jgi:hypothetical protein